MKYLVPSISAKKGTIYKDGPIPESMFLVLARANAAKLFQFCAERNIEIPLDIIKEIVFENKEARKFVAPGTKMESIDVALIRADWNYLEFIPAKDQTALICQEAIVTRNPAAIGYIKNQTYEQCFFVINQSPCRLGMINKPNRTKELIDLAISKDPSALRYVRNNERTDEIVYKALYGNPLVIKYLRTQKLDFVLASLKRAKELGLIKDNGLHYSPVSPWRYIRYKFGYNSPLELLEKETLKRKLELLK